MKIADMVKATQEDVDWSQRIFGKLHPSTLAVGYVNHGAIPGGVQIDFLLIKPYGHRSVKICRRSIGQRYVYSVAVYKYGRNFSERLFDERLFVPVELLSEAVSEMLELSCDPRSKARFFAQCLKCGWCSQRRINPKAAEALGADHFYSLLHHAFESKHHCALKEVGK